MAMRKQKGQGAASNHAITENMRNETGEHTSSFILPRSLYRSHVLTTFLGPALGAMMKQVCWHSPCHCFLMLAPLEAIAENKTEQKSGGKRAVAKSTPKAAKDARFPTARSV